MNKYLAVALTLLIPCLAQAQKKKIFFYELDLINGLFFKPNTIAPYSGLAYEEHPDGSKKMHVPIKDGKINGTVGEWERNGEKVYEAHYEMGVQTGTEKQWYANGAKKLVVSYANGQASGTCTEWFKNGIKKSEGLYTNGKEEGDHFWWYNTGEKDQQITYQYGKPQGKVRNWYRNGQLKLEKTFKDGVEDGPTTEYYENGQKKSSGHFVDGAPHGESRFWSKKGQLMGIQQFDNGTLVKDINYQSGNIRIKGGYLEVFNEMESFFTVKILGEEVVHRKSFEIVYVVDGKLLQLIHNSVNLFAPDYMGSETDKDLLDRFQTKESDYIREKTDSNIEVTTEWITTAAGQQVLHWWFASPSSKDEEQKLRTVQEEHYLSLICNKQVLSLYGIVTNSDKITDVVAMLRRVADNVTISPQRIDLNTVAGTLHN